MHIFILYFFFYFIYYLPLFFNPFSFSTEFHDPWRERIEHVPFGGYHQYFAALARAQIVVVPLLVDRFNECKSAIRYFEASLLSVPTVASRVGQFREVITEGETGYLAEGETQWREALTALVGDADLRRRVGEAAREAVFAAHSLELIGERFAPLLAEYRLEAFK